jgi:hypothetical protein
MRRFFGFNDLKVGQMLKVKGKPDESGKFAAMEISVKETVEDAAIEGRLQSIDHPKNKLRLFNHEISVPDGVEFKGLQDKSLGLKGLKVGEVVKLKGKYSATTGFNPDKIKIKEAMDYNVDELQGVVDEIDYAANTLEMVGFTVMATPRTTIEGF